MKSGKEIDVPSYMWDVEERKTNMETDENKY